MSEFTLQVKNLHARYHTRFGEDIYAVDGVSLNLLKGKVLGIAGESGCGKSTLANCLMGCFFKPLHYTSGELIIDGVDAVAIDPETFRKEVLGKKIAYIPQAAMNTLNPTLKIKSFLMDVLKEHKPEMSKVEMMELATERFKALGLDPKVLNAYPNELSGGMKQRTVIAISTILNPKVLVADEPTSALDVTSQKKVILLIKRLLIEGYVESIVFITHELPLLYHVADKIAIMYAGQIVERGSSEDVVFDALHPYAKALMGSIIVPELDMKEHKLYAIPGAPPNLKQKLTGCRFYDRCKERQSFCKETNPEIKTVEHREHRCLIV
ncbi:MULTISPECIES: ABC transporter ATP-binding protein [unclassified Fusibacter]|uniref:ABC transporter ATP-binding protein n=1 Tax=unclassified Fusibacter TaxID=2624464 RepID=UPI001012097E|nr:MULTISPECIES: ABC transporter ATP-binding protein [unclassified Fusibacter]MCK8060220.1 ABC transporter ATP-binding protein [Fusibacter sp. A2]NPE22361.1 ABC transporter ATP-binding protein [Fusibacter sp. A1]RXV61133.1 ABC transporter ATP-binding protein [Fusibacter sp. A1]